MIRKDIREFMIGAVSGILVFGWMWLMMFPN